MINQLNESGPQSLPTDVEKQPLRYDVSFDGLVSAIDALAVINKLNRGEGQDEKIVAVQIKVVDKNNQPIPNNRVKVGQDARVQLITQDLRFAATGVFAAYADMDYNDPSLFGVVFGETQTVTFSNNATGGTFTLAFDGGITAPVTLQRSLAQTTTDIRLALEALPNINPGDVEVLHKPFTDPQDSSNSNPFIWDIRFVGQYRGQDVPLMGVNTAQLTPVGQVTGNVVEKFPADINNPGTFRSSFVPGPIYPNGLTATAGTNQFDEVGSFDGTSSPDPTAEFVVLHVDIEAMKAGTLTFQASPADEPGSAVLVLGSDDVVPTNMVDYGTTVTIIITQPVNAIDDSFGNIVEDSMNNLLTVLSNDFLEDGSTGTLALDPTGLGTPSAGGTVTIVNGQISYKPAKDFFGTETFTYRAVDGLGNSDTATVSVTVVNVNDPPDAINDAFTVLEDSSNNTLSPLANDVVGPANENETLTITAVGATSNGGTVTIINNSTQLSYTPAANFFGTDTFTYTVSDGNGGTDTATIDVTVTNVNDNPNANDDAFTVQEDSSNNPLNVLANDSILPDANETLTITAVGATSNGGTVNIVSGTSLTYTPAANFFGAETFTYTISDGNGGTDTATVTVTVTNINDPPAANDDQFFVDEFSTDNSLDVLTNDSFAPDPQETLTITNVSTPNQGGSVTIAVGGGSLVYSPQAGKLAPFTETFTYTISDGNGGSDTATVSVDVEPVIRPRARDDSATVNEDSTNNVINVMSNDLFNDGAERQITRIVTGPSNGTAAIFDNGTPGDPTDDVIRYTPNANFFGTDTLEYEIDDDFVDPMTQQPSAPDTATVTITVTNVNDPPTANDDTFTVQEDSVGTLLNVVANDSFAPDPTETLTITNVSATSAGSTVTIVNNRIRYTPPANFFGTDTFTYTISDGNGGTDTANVTVTVENVNDPPTANPDTFTVDEDSVNVTLDVLANDDDAPDVGETLTIVNVSPPSRGGTAQVISGSSISYTPVADFFGTETFNYTISDGNGGTATALVTVTVNNVNDDPTANNDTALALKNTVNLSFVDQEIRVLDNDTIAPDINETLTIVSVDNFSANGTAKITNGGQRLLYTPALNFEGFETFTYTVSDGNGGSDTATVTVEVVDAIPSDVSGRVFVDVDNDGVHDPGEMRLAGIEVTITGRTVRGDVFTQTVKTDAAGNYLFPAVLPSSLNANDPGYSITAKQAKYMIDGKDTIGDQGGTAHSNVDLLANVKLDIFGQGRQNRPAAQNNNFGERGVKAEFITIAEMFASRTNKGLIIATNTSGDEFWWALLEGWNGVKHARVSFNNDMSQATLHVTDRNNQVHTKSLATRGTRNFRFMGDDGNGGIIVRIDGTAAELGVPLAMAEEAVDAAADGQPYDEVVTPEAEVMEMIAQAEAQYAEAIDQLITQWA